MPDGVRFRRPPLFYRSAWIRRSRTSARTLVIALRLSAVLASALLLILAWHLIAALPWPLAGVIALVASLTFAYCFERGDES